MGKTFKPDVLSKKRYKNTGQVDSYYLENALPPIVSKETWELVQYEIKHREENTGVSGLTYGKFTSQYPFSRLIRCGCCGSFYIRNKNMRLKKEHIAAWCCSKHFNNANECPQHEISEESIKRAFVQVLNTLADSIEELKAMVKTSIKEKLSESPSKSPEQLELEIIALQEEMLELHKKKTKGLIDPKEYGIQGQALASKIDFIKKQHDEAKSKMILHELLEKRMEDISKVVDNIKPTDEFNEMLFRNLVENITISKRTRITFKFKLGFERTVEATIK